MPSFTVNPQSLRPLIPPSKKPPAFQSSLEKRHLNLLGKEGFILLVVPIGGNIRIISVFCLKEWELSASYKAIGEGTPAGTWK